MTATSNWRKRVLAAAVAAASQSLTATAAHSQGAGIEGARYSFVKNFSNGNWQTVFYRIIGNTVTETSQSYMASANHTFAPSTRKFTLENGKFFARMEADQCIRGWNTDDCGRLGVVKDD